MKLLSILFFVIIANHSSAQVGIGVVWIDFERNTKIDLYKDPGDKHYARQIEFFYDQVVDNINIKDYHLGKKWLEPELIRLDYSELNFIVKSQKTGWLEIVVNKDDGSTLWLKESEEINLVPWKEYLTGMFSVERINPKAMFIYEQPSLDSEKIEFEGKDCFKVKEVKEDWIEIFSNENCDHKTKSVIRSGWLQWKKDDKLLIEYHTTS